VFDGSCGIVDRNCPALNLYADHATGYLQLIEQHVCHLRSVRVSRVHLLYNVDELLHHQAYAIVLLVVVSLDEEVALRDDGVAVAFLPLEVEEVGLLE
jgi:hypothetical protein